MKIQLWFSAILDLFLGYEPFFIDIPKTIMQFIKVLCHKSGFWNMGPGKLIQSENDSFELTDLENIGISS